jgi:hypothetical protein
MRSLHCRTLCLAVALFPVAAGAQGTLSTQGFGYPGGQLSTRALGAGGALAEGDPNSATNPAAIFNFGMSVLYFQAEPEYRTVTAGGASQKATIARYPLVSAGVPIGSSFFGAITVSNLLDRSFLTSIRGVQTVGGETVASTNTFQSNGAIGDVRVALAWAPITWLHLGAAGHVITGDNKLNSTQRFDDTLKFAALVDTQTVTYTGTAYSGGFDLDAGGIATFSGSYRRGGPLSIKHGDTTFRSAKVPDRLAVGAAFVGLRGTMIGVRAARDTWSNMRGLFADSSQAIISDAWDTSVGADVLGPRLFGAPLQLRAGARRRTLPFGTPQIQLPADGLGPGQAVKETSYSFGAGGAIGRGHATYDLALIHASRTAGSLPISEKAWTFSVGLSVRP